MVIWIRVWIRVWISPLWDMEVCLVCMRAPVWGLANSYPGNCLLASTVGGVRAIRLIVFLNEIKSCGQLASTFSSHTLAVESPQAVASCRPSGLKATLVTHPVCCKTTGLWISACQRSKGGRMRVRAGGSGREEGHLEGSGVLPTSEVPHPCCLVVTAAGGQLPAVRAEDDAGDLPGVPLCGSSSGSEQPPRCERGGGSRGGSPCLP